MAGDCPVPPKAEEVRLRERSCMADPVRRAWLADIAPGHRGSWAKADMHEPYGSRLGCFRVPSEGMLDGSRPSQITKGGYGSVCTDHQGRQRSGAQTRRRRTSAMAIG